MHTATTRSCLIASPSFPLVLAPGFQRAGSEAVDLTSIAPTTDKDLRAAASTQKHPAIRYFIGRVRHTTPRPAPAFNPDPIKHAAVLEAVKARPGNLGVCLYGRATADLDSFRARRRSKSTVGAEECSRRGSNQRINLTKIIRKSSARRLNADPDSHRQMSRTSGLLGAEQRF